MTQSFCVAQAQLPDLPLSYNKGSPSHKRVAVSAAQYASMLTEHDVPAEVVTLVTYPFGEVLDGRNAHLTDGVQRALGREPRDFADYARGAGATGVWDGRR